MKKFICSITKPITYFVICLAMALLVACGGGGGGSSTDGAITISGIISTGVVTQQSPIGKLMDVIVADAYAAGMPDLIVAYSTAGNYLNQYPINADGSFEIDVSTLGTDNFILFVVDSVTQTVYGHIKLGSTASLYTVEGFDRTMFVDSLNLGTIDINDLTGPDVENINVFSDEDKALLLKMATNDDALAMYINSIVNQDISSYITVRCVIGTRADIKDVPYDVSTFSKASNYDGMVPLFYYWGADKETLTSVSLFPPSAILWANFGANYVNPADASTPIITPAFWNPGAGVNVIYSASVDSLPDGVWLLENAADNSNLGSFVFSEAKPFDASDNFTAFVPDPMINTDASDNITSVTLAWHRDNGAAFEVVDQQYFDTLTSKVLISYVVAGVSTTTNMTMTRSADGIEFIFEPQGVLNFADLERLIISYHIGQVKYQFFVH